MSAPVATPQVQVGDRVTIMTGMHGGTTGVVTYVTSTAVTVEHMTPPPGWPVPVEKRVTRLPYAREELTRA